MNIKIGTRGSKLALWQAYHVKDELLKNNITSEIIIIETKGDKILDVALSKIGSKGVFTEELEQKLLSQDIDIAVHSAKDVQSHLPPMLEISAYTKREMANDVLVSFDSKFELTNDSSCIVGSSSTRRVAFLKKYYPNITIVDMRGNLQTRFEKLKSGTCQAMLLAFAGVHRMDLDAYIVAHLPLQTFIPPVGQGSVAIQNAIGLDIDKKNAIKRALNDTITEQCLVAERSFLYTIHGGCSIPTFAHACFVDGYISIHGGIISLDGSKIVEHTLTSTNPLEVGQMLANYILQNGGKEILDDILINK